MAEIGVCLGMPETDGSALKEALFAQQQLLQKLDNELDEEREASATAASEALSMILRLQGEKAAVKMEADQYKRMAEEKMCHADLSLEVFEDVIYQKEMEITSLEFQVQAYRYKLLSMGYPDFGPSETKLLDNLFLQRGDVSNGGKGLNGGVRRLNSVPPICLKDHTPKKGIIKRQKSAFPNPDVDSRIVEENPDLEGTGESLKFEKTLENSSNGDFSPVWEQIRRLGDRENDISECRDTSQTNNDFSIGMSRSCAIVSSVSALPCYATRECVDEKSVQMNYCENLYTAEAVENNSASSTSVQDIFEVPQSDESCKSQEVHVKEWSKQEPEGENRLGKPDLVTDQTDWIKKMLLSLNHDKMPSSPRLRGKMGADCDGVQEAHKARVLKYRSELQQLSARIERLETEGNARSREIVHENVEEMNLLKEIREQLNSIQREMRHENKRKDTQPYDLPLLNLTEAMLHFWL